MSTPASRLGFESKGARNRAASALLGVNVRDVPKSGLAVVAVYLAARASAHGDNLAAAADLLWQEWEILHEQGIVAQRCPRKAGR